MRSRECEFSYYVAVKTSLRKQTLLRPRQLAMLLRLPCHPRYMLGPRNSFHTPNTKPNSNYHVDLTLSSYRILCLFIC